MNKYRKKPVVIEALEWTGENFNDIETFCKCAVERTNFVIDGGPCLFIMTLEDGPNNEVKHVASQGDYIIKGIQGEFYPCKPDIFKATYEIVD